MDYKKIEDLLDNYWNGVTSLEQEKELVEFFTKEEVPAHLKEYQPLFQFFQEEKEVEVSTSFEANLIAELEKEAQKEKHNEVASEAKVKRLWTPLLRIAATVALVCGMFFTYQNYSVEQVNEFAMVDSFDTPEEAYRETMKALKLVSKKMDKGTKTTIMALPSAGYMTKMVGKKKRK